MSGTLPLAIYVAPILLQTVGFVEGWFVREPFRNRGVGRELMRAAEQWARARGCREMASEIVDRCVHFRKAL
jgi:GNAT superfamily N-acetyltransferase